MHALAELKATVLQSGKMLPDHAGTRWVALPRVTLMSLSSNWLLTKQAEEPPKVNLVTCIYYCSNNCICCFGKEGRKISKGWLTVMFLP
jgi:hypothetical protein